MRYRVWAPTFFTILLPQYRGFSPTVWAIINGEDHTGATLFRIADGVDEGDIVDQERIAIGPHETIGTVLERVTQAYLTLLESEFGRPAFGKHNARCSRHKARTYTCKRLPEDNLIDWAWPTKRIYHLIRGSNFSVSGRIHLFEWSRNACLVGVGATDPKTYVSRVPGRVAEVRPGSGFDCLNW